MTNRLITANRTATNNTVFAANSLTNELGISIKRGIEVEATAGTAIRATGGAVTVDVRGTVLGTGGMGIHLGGQPGADLSNAVQVHDGAAVRGTFDAVRFVGFGSTLYNEGLVRGSSVGVRLGGQFDDGGPETSTIRNAGMIEGGRAIVVNAGTTEGVSIQNDRGSVIREIGRGVNAIVSEATTGLGLEIRNSGQIVGNIQMGGTADRFDGLGGIVRGTVFGRGGNDTFAPGANAERLNGGAGVDTIVFTGDGGVRVTLGGAFGSNTGAAQGDSYVGIERVLGSALGRDDLRGSGSANTLDGRGGADRLSGGGGADVLVGGMGRDVTTGGGGNDTFQFRSVAEGGDRITDFSRISGNNDRFRLDDRGFDAALDNGALDATQFRARQTSNAAVDADDRFVFRASDTTLWFDRDGAGEARPVLLADLQAGAVVTAADIFIF